MNAEEQYTDKICKLLSEQKQKGLTNFKMFVTANPDAAKKDVLEEASGMLESFLFGNADPICDRM